MSTENPEPIYHLTPESEFRAGLDAACYRPLRFDADGFVHCAATPGSVLAVAQDYFAEVSERLLVLQIGSSALTSPLVFEAAAPIAGGGVSHLAEAPSFPHIYGPVNLPAVTGIAVLARRDGVFQWPERFIPLDELLRSE